MCYCKARIGVAEWKHFGSDFGWEPGRICANLTRLQAEGRAREKGKRGWGTVGRQGGWVFKQKQPVIHVFFFLTARTSISHPIVLLVQD